MEIQGIPTALKAGDPDDGDVGRRMRGALIAGIVAIKRNKIGYSVPSQSGNGAYTVSTDDGGFCTCPDYELRQQPCKHLYSVWCLIQREEMSDGSIQETTKAVRMTYSQDWKAYNAAQTNEEDHFRVLLRSLCDTVEQPVYNFGRPCLPVSDVIYGMAYKVYSGMSGRRAKSRIRSATKDGLLEKTPCYSTLFRYMEDPEMSEHLLSLITLSSLPLRDVEVDFAPDSSGFATTCYNKWFSKKWGKEIKEALWVKGHIMTGVKTNIITAAYVTDVAGNDSPYLRKFLDTTAEYFEINEVSADKAYLSKPNLWAIHDAGATPYIPFKKNSVAHNPKQKYDALWARMFHYFNYNRAEFLEHYHKRSNVESTFNMVKSKFNEKVRSKTPVAQCNEVLTKFICHNLVVLIHEMYELGIDPTFEGHLPIDREMAALTGSGPEIQSRMAMC